ncbi:MAG TPA: energy transducer TonB [Draconibacterium sp.]|nr:energy transducer TonB [Draconibacterium sp.]
MKPILFIVLLVFFAGLSIQAQEQQKKHGDVYFIADVMPEYPGGMDALKQLLVDNVKYPEQAKKDNVEGKVYVTFIVDENGNVQDEKIARGVNPELDAEALRVVKLMPKWTPGKEGGKTVKVSFTLPVQFALN